MTYYRLGDNLFVCAIDGLSQQEAQVWDGLMQVDGLCRAFMSRTYAEAVATTGAQVIVLIGYGNGVPTFFLPLQRRTGVLGYLGIFEPVGGVMTDYFGVVARERTQLDMPALLKATRGVVNAVFFTHLDETQARYGLLAAEQRTGLRTHLGDPAHHYWPNLRKTDKKLVYDTERREKKLIADHGELQFEWSSSQPQEDLAWLIVAKQSQYSRTGKEQAPLYDPAKVALLEKLLDAQYPHCEGVLSVLRSGGKMVAAHFGLRCHGMLHVWFPVYDQNYANYSPGRVLFKHMFNAGAAHGVTVFDRGEGDNQAKRDFANEEHRFGRGLWIAASLRGQIAYIGQRFCWRFGFN